MGAGMSRRTCAWLLLSLLFAARPAAAGDGDQLYQWRAADGSLHITESLPPAGATLLRTYQAVDAPAIPAPPAAAPLAQPPAASTLDDDLDPCGAHPELIRAWVDAVTERAKAEHEIAWLDSDPTYASESLCVPGSTSFGRCTFQTYSRDRALDRANERRELAQAKVERAEEAAVRGHVPDRCLVEPGQ
jgi:hypothetical protein